MTNNIDKNRIIFFKLKELYIIVFFKKYILWYSWFIMNLENILFYMWSILSEMKRLTNNIPTLLRKRKYPKIGNVNSGLAIQ